MSFHHIHPSFLLAAAIVVVGYCFEISDVFGMILFGILAAMMLMLMLMIMMTLVIIIMMATISLAVTMLSTV